MSDKTLIQCSKCNTKLPWDANFCYKCGIPQKGILSGNPDSPTYEHCQLAYIVVKESGFRAGQLRIVANAIGPKGAYEVDFEDFPPDWEQEPNQNVEDHRDYVNILVTSLIEEGWESIETGPTWWQHKFRRAITT